mmetsp:Transcript_21909/g.30859  ORF Transcript_21909/g.30859 Transcript_21909/m.30859 type:complete len:764 (-) Transcript_21909:521-2812(-)
MDVSIVAAIGSFAISERVLRPKATILVILASVLAYDLTTKTHDPSSLRIYRGPALAAFTLLCCAYSLRTWRRNGVACDELIFLPGTPYENRNNDNKNDYDTENNMISDDLNNPPGSPESAAAHIHIISEGDAAGGIALQPVGSRDQTESLMQSIVPIVSVSSSPTRSEHGSSSLSLGARKISHDSDRDDENKSKSSVDSDLDSWDESNKSSFDEEVGSGADAAEADQGNNERRRNNPFCPNYYGRSRAERRSVNGSLNDDAASTSTPESGQSQQRRTEFQRFRENHPRITRLGTFFFFRSRSSPSESTMYAPSGPMVFGAALDLSMPILFNFHLFIEAYNHITSSGSETPAKILPLIFLSVLMVRSVIPPGRRGRFWSTVKFTAMAPFHSVNFRDAFIGDVMTSLVRPIQDVLFALTYYFTVIWGTLFRNYGLAEATKILERSWFLHNIVLTSFALLPLWWKFLQCLRMSYDSGKRWPYLGDAFKYLSAALVILFGMTHPEDRICFWWIFAFTIATLYQIWWDTVMDWELLVITPKNESQSSLECRFSCTISSLRPTSSFLLMIQMYLIQPLEDALRRVCHSIPNLDQINLRPKRLYKSETFYWKIFLFNAVFRFTWMLCFIPPYKLSGDKEQIFSSDVSTPIGVLLPILEILRRTFWGFLKVETETLRLMDADVAYTRVENNSDVEEEGSVNKFRPSAFHQFMPVWMDTEQRQKQMAATSTSNSKLIQHFQCSESTLDKLFLAELALWVLAFVGFGYVTAYA